MGNELEQYRRAFERAFDAMVFANDEGKFLDANQSACDLFGLEKDDLLGRSFEEFTPEQYEFESEWMAVRVPGDDTDTFPLVRENGQRRTVRYSIARDVSAGVHLSILRDITESEKRKRKLQETQSKYRQLVEQNLVGIYIIQDRKFTYVNPRLAEIFNETPEEMIGRSPFEWIANEDHEQVAENLRKREEEEVDSLKFTVTGTRSNGETFDFQVYGGRVDVGGQPAILGTLQDVTERKEQERTLERQNERLEEFVHIVSHDLRNPLTIAQGRVKLAREECDSDHLDAVIGAHERIDTLVEDLLLLAENGDSVIETEHLDIADLMETSWQNVETKDAQLVNNTTAVITGDRSRLQQLGENLLRNAVEHGGNAVTITIGDLDNGRGFYIEDNGPGIPVPQRERVFDRGYSESERGTGIGLSIVKRIVDAHGWKVSVTESDDGGARFEFSLEDSA